MRYCRLPNWCTRKELFRLKDLSNPPKTLFYAGTWNPNIFTNCVAVVGSRRMTEYGRRVIEKIVPQLVFEGKTIVSGFMYGVDQYAHDVCVQKGGKTVAVLGWGITRKLDGTDKKLADAIIDAGGLLISEWENQEATRWTFPVRNRIVVALSSEVIVVEAGIKSGSLITANLAHQLGRNLWVATHSSGTDLLTAQNIAKRWGNLV